MRRNRYRREVPLRPQRSPDKSTPLQRGTLEKILTSDLGCNESPKRRVDPLDAYERLLIARIDAKYR